MGCRRPPNVNAEISLIALELSQGRVTQVQTIFEESRADSAVLHDNANNGACWCQCPKWDSVHHGRGGGHSFGNHFEFKNSLCGYLVVPEALKINFVVMH